MSGRQNGGFCIDCVSVGIHSSSGADVSAFHSEQDVAAFYLHLQVCSGITGVTVLNVYM